MKSFACTVLRLIPYAVLIFATLGPVAHAEEGLTYLEGAGRYADLAQTIEARLARGEQASSTLLGPLCMAYGKLQRFDKLFDCVAKLEVRIAGGDLSIKSDIPGNRAAHAEPVPGMLLAEAYMDLGDYPRSIKEGERALAALPANRSIDFSVWPPVKFRLTILPNLAIAEALGGDQVQAKNHLAQLENISIPYLGGAGTGPLKENGLARVYISLGEYAKATDHLGSRGMSGFLMAFVGLLSPFAYRGDSLATLNELPRLFMLAKTQLELGHLDASREALNKLFSNKRLPDFQDIYWLALSERARLELLEKRPDDAIKDWRKAIDVIEAQRTSINTEASKIGFAGNTQDVYRRLIAGLFESGNMQEAFEYVERSKSRALVDMLASKKDFSVQAADEAKVRELLARVDQSEDEARSSAYVSSPPADPKASETSATRGDVRTTALQGIAQAAPELSSLVSVSSTPLAEIQQRIAEDEALVEYYYDDKSLFAFVLTTGGLQTARLDANGLEGEVRLLRTVIEQPDSEVYLHPAQRLYARLMQPIEPLLAGRTKLIVVAHGALHYLPFAALHDGSGFLVEKYSLRFLPSASVVKYLRPSRLTKPGGILAFGNPDLGDAKYDLRFAQDEALAVVQTMPQSRALVRSEATESALRQYAPGFRYLHFATHGEFDAQAPLQSALVLAKDGTGNGLLTVGKLYSMRLDADLVTLSACETGLGKIVSGDDVIGLTRGFLYAGASTIVASLWQVDDQATAALMTSFYEGLESNGKREALHQAQLATKKKFPHPYFWAAFQLTGSAI